MPRIARLITSFSNKEIGNLLKSARIATRHPGLDIRVAASSAAYARVLVITPRKMGSAPERNKIRRQIKAIFYTNKLFENKKDLIVYCKKGCSNLSFTELTAYIMQASHQFQNASTI